MMKRKHLYFSISINSRTKNRQLALTYKSTVRVRSQHLSTRDIFKFNAMFSNSLDIGWERTSNCTIRKIIIKKQSTTYYYVKVIAYRYKNAKKGEEKKVMVLRMSFVLKISHLHIDTA